HAITEAKLRETAPDELKQTLDVETEQLLLADGTIIPAHAGIRLNIYAQAPSNPSPPVMRLFHYGERIRLPVKLKLPRNFRNPGAFDYQGYLAAHGIAALGSAKIGDVQLLPGFVGS